MAPGSYTRFLTNYYEIKDQLAVNLKTFLRNKYYDKEILDSKNTAGEPWQEVIPFCLAIRDGLGMPGERIFNIYNNELNKNERRAAKTLLKNELLGDAAFKPKNTRLEGGTLKIAVDLSIWFANNKVKRDEKKLAKIAQTKEGKFLIRQQMKTERKLHNLMVDIEEFSEENQRLVQQNEALKRTLAEEKEEREKLLKKWRDRLEFTKSHSNVKVKTLHGLETVNTTIRVTKKEKKIIQENAQVTYRKNRLSDIFMVQYPKVKEKFLNEKFGSLARIINEYLPQIPNTQNIVYPLNEVEKKKIEAHIEESQGRLYESDFVVVAVSLPSDDKTQHPHFCDKCCTSKCILCGTFDRVAVHYFACYSKDEVILPSGRVVVGINIELEATFGSLAKGHSERGYRWAHENIFNDFFSIWRADKSTKLVAISMKVSFHRCIGLFGNYLGLTLAELKILCDAYELYDSDDSLVLFRANTRSPKQFHEHEFLARAKQTWMKDNNEHVKKKTEKAAMDEQRWIKEIEEERKSMSASTLRRNERKRKRDDREENLPSSKKTKRRKKNAGTQGLKPSKNQK